MMLISVVVYFRSVTVKMELAAIKDLGAVNVCLDTGEKNVKTVSESFVP